jgi:hypothetical protein
MRSRISSGRNTMDIWKQRYDEMILTCAHTGKEREEALEKLRIAEERIRELKQDRDILHQDGERWRKMAQGRSPDVKALGAVTISRNGYIKEVEAERDALSGKLDLILEITTHDDPYWAMEEIGRICDSENVNVDAQIPASRDSESITD